MKINSKFTLNILVAMLMSNSAFAITEREAKGIARQHALQFQWSSAVHESEFFVERSDIDTPRAFIMFVENGVQTNQIGCTFRVVIDSHTGQILEEAITSKGWFLSTYKAWECRDYGSDYGGVT